MQTLLRWARRLIYKVPRIKHLSPQPLELNDFSEYNQPYHPSVLYFPRKLYGYRFWMVQSPYPKKALPYRDRWECPCIYWSNDGWTWETNDILNPLDDLDRQQIMNGDYFSDPHLVYRDDLKSLECWYRLSKKNPESIGGYDTSLVRRTTFDGENWGPREGLVNFRDVDDFGEIIRSPSIIWSQNARCYRMWYVDGLANSKNKNIVYAESFNGLDWNNKTKISLDKYIAPWHIDVNKFDDKYHLINYTLTGDRALYYYESLDGVNFNFVTRILKPSRTSWNSFYRAELYRSCSVKVDEEIRVFFSSSDGIKTFIGVMTGTAFKDLRVIDVSKKVGRQRLIG